MKKNFKNNQPGKNLFIWVVLFILVAGAYDIFNSFHISSKNLPFSDFLKDVENGQITKVSLRGNTISGTMADGTKFVTLSPNNYLTLTDRLYSHNVTIDVVPIDTPVSSFFSILASWFPILLLIGVWFFFMNQMQGGGGKAMGFGKSKAKMISQKDNKTTFNDVAGVEEAKEELEELVDFLKDPMKFQKVGGKIPKGCLLVGPPGTGKTLLARAIAGEAKVPFFSISGSDFVEMFVGVGASRVRDMFEQAKKHSPCIIFIDEIDAVGRQRGVGLGGGNDEREQTLNQMLVEMDGFNTNEGVIVLAATNRPDVLDPALLRPGRFDRRVTVSNPDIKGRCAIIAVHLKKIKAGPDVDVQVIARGTPGFSGADLANMVNEGALLAARKNHNIVTMRELEEAKDKVMMGPERKSAVMTEQEKKLTAYHEGGHALVAASLEGADPIHKATIIPRGSAGGMVQMLPQDDRNYRTVQQLNSDIAVAMGGRVAESLIFGEEKITTGASSDIKAATKYARGMVTQFGMSNKVGPVFVESSDDGYPGGNAVRQSDDLKYRIDEEVKGLVDDGYKLAHKILSKNINKLHDIAKYLLEYETLTGNEIQQIIEGKKIEKDDKKETIQKRKSIVPASKKNKTATQEDSNIDDISVGNDKTSKSSAKAKNSKPRKQKSAEKIASKKSAESKSIDDVSDSDKK